jgi:hypothetical protein
MSPTCPPAGNRCTKTVANLVRAMQADRPIFPLSENSPYILRLISGRADQQKPAGNCERL